MVNWRVNVLNQSAVEEIDALPPDMRSKLDHIVRMIEELGLHQVREPYIKALRGKLWEIRIKGRDGIARAIYVTREGTPHHHSSCVPQEDPEDTRGGDSDRLVENEGARTMTIPFTELRKKWEKDPDFRKEYESLQPEFQLARVLIEARAKSGLSQREVAERMGTSQPTVARLESGHKPSLKTLERYAAAVGMKIEIHLVGG